MKFELNLRRRNISEAEIIADLQRVAIEIGAERLTTPEYILRGQFGVNTVLRKFGSWNKALECAELKVNNRTNIPDEELFENLANVWQSLGRQPYGREMDKAAGHSKFSAGTYEKRYGSWNSALLSFIEYVDAGTVEKSSIQTEIANAKTQSSRVTSRKINWRLRAAILIRDNCICQMCGASPSRDPDVVLHVDHVIPYSKGGETLEENLQTLCAKCNIGKSDVIFE